jgi:hypothetical protein
MEVGMRRSVLAACLLVSMSLGIVSAIPAAADPVLLGPVEPSYVIELATGERGRVWTGTEGISFVNASSEPLDLVYLRLWSNGEVTCAEPGIVVSNVTGGTAGALEKRCTALPITLDAPVPPGGVGQLSMDLEIRVPKESGRFGSANGLTAVGNAIPVLAVFDDEGWHLDPYVSFGESFYSLVGDFEVTLVTPATLDTPTTGVETAIATTPDGREARTYIATDVRDFVWAAGELRRTVVTATDGTRVNLWYRPEDLSTKKAERRLAYSAESVGLFSESFGAYPYDELDVVIGFFETFSGMEYPQLIFTVPFAFVISHEIAHQWWYGIVGDDQFESPWLDEAFATWSMALPLEPWVGCAMFKWPNDEVRLTSGMDYYAEHPEDYWFPYFQGACALGKLAKTFGLERFIEILGAYAADHWLGVTTTEDFQAAIEAAAAEDALDWDPAKFWERWRIGDPVPGEPLAPGRAPAPRFRF